MDVFNKNERRIIAYTKEQVEYRYKFYNANLLELGMEKALSKDSKDMIETENYQESQNTIINDNKEDKIGSSTLIIASSNQRQDINIIQPKMIVDNINEISKESTEAQTKKKEKMNRTDNKRIQCGTSFMDQFFTFVNELCKEQDQTLNRINFKSQYGCNVDMNKQFISAKLYQIFIYGNKDNKKVIEKMIDKKHDKFIYLMLCTFEFLYNEYIGTSNTLRSKLNYPSFPSFPTLEDAVKKKRNKLSKGDLSEKEIKEEIETFKKLSKNFINNINREGKEIDFHEREKKKYGNNYILCKYEEMPEIETYFKK